MVQIIMIFNIMLLMISICVYYAINKIMFYVKNSDISFSDTINIYNVSDQIMSDQIMSDQIIDKNQYNYLEGDIIEERKKSILLFCDW